MPFYPFHQNNSGGRYCDPAIYVYIEAPTANLANRIAGEYDIYFNGVAYERDCECCGDRWSEAYYDSEGLANPYEDWIFKPEYKTWHSPRDGVAYGMIYYADGRKEEVPYPT